MITRRRGLIAGGVAGLLASILGTRAGSAGAAQAGQRLEGAWLVTILVEGQPEGRNITVFNPDGTAINITPSPASLVGGGEWVRIGDHRFAATFVQFNRDAEGRLLGTGKIRATIEVNAALDAFSGEFQFDLSDTGGNLLASAQGTVEATRIGVEPL